jgi:PAS domain-containing protein
MPTAAALAGRWLTALDGTADTLLSRPELRAFLTERGSELLDYTGTPTAADVARQLVDANLHTLAAIEATMTVVAEALADAPRAAEVIAGLGAGFAAALQERSRREQESLLRSALDAVRTAERDRQESEARFRAVFADAAVGIGMVGLNGRVIDVNNEFARMIGAVPRQMGGQTVDP